MNQTIVIYNVDIDLLKKQRATLIEVRQMFTYDSILYKEISGILHLLDACIDAADYNDLNETIARHLG